MSTETEQILHYVNDSATAEYLLLSANLEHAATGSWVEYRDGLWIVDGVQVDSLQKSLDLLREEDA
jgi:hypothetical protein